MARTSLREVRGHDARADHLGSLSRLVKENGGPAGDVVRYYPVGRCSQLRRHCSRPNGPASDPVSRECDHVRKARPETDPAILELASLHP